MKRMSTMKIRVLDHDGDVAFDYVYPCVSYSQFAMTLDRAVERAGESKLDDDDEDPRRDQQLLAGELIVRFQRMIKSGIVAGKRDETFSVLLLAYWFNDPSVQALLDEAERCGLDGMIQIPGSVYESIRCGFREIERERLRARYAAAF
jgi:hypothetical protein